ncbi:MAG: fatty acid desaturase [Geminicoccaceae bacterium]
MTERPLNAAAAVHSARAWNTILKPYREPNSTRGIVELMITTVPFILLWTLAWLSLGVSYWLSLAFVVAAAGFLVRLFAIQHDCGHGSFFSRKRVNDWVGRILGVLTFTPYEVWRRDHAMHHSASGNLDKRGFGDIDTLTVREYFELTTFGRFRYRLYRSPIVLFIIGPAYQFLVRHRWPLGRMRTSLAPWTSAMTTNLAIAVVASFMIWLVGLVPFLLVQLPITLLASSIGVWLFYVQHQFEETTWSEGATWDLSEAALHGSSYYDLPGILRWLTANLGVHHVHHLCSRIPSYRLPEVLRDHPSLTSIGRLTLLESLRCIRLSLWDEHRERLVSFREVASYGFQPAAGALRAVEKA